VTIRGKRAQRRSFAGAVSRLAFIVFLLCCAGGAGAAGPADALRAHQPGQELSVLFIGNSLTYVNDLPLIVQALARSADKSLYVESVSFGGFNLEDHWNRGDALAAIESRDWNVVVLQQGPSSLPESRVDLRTWNMKFAPLIRRSGAVPALYMVWPAIDRLPFFDDVRDSYSLAAYDVRGIFLPAGEAWRAAWRRDPEAPLYGDDDFHPSNAGSYAAALSIYGMLYKRSPQGLPARLELANGAVVEVPQDLAILLQEAATEANRTYGRPRPPIVRILQ
jgi:hypothetical protein